AAEVQPENRFYTVTPADGEPVTGRLLNHDTFTVQLLDQDERRRSFSKAQLLEHGFADTPMPAYGDELTAGEIADVVSYLASLRGETAAAATACGSVVSASAPPTGRAAAPAAAAEPSSGGSSQGSDGVTFERILNAEREPQNWLSYSGTVSNQRHSRLDGIDTGNVADLELAWVWQARSLEKLEATALAV